MYGKAKVPWILPDEKVFQSEVIFLVRREPFGTHVLQKNMILTKFQFFQRGTFLAWKKASFHEGYGLSRMYGKAKVPWILHDEIFFSLR